MKRFDWQWLALSSVLLTALAAQPQTRPQYGGTLHAGTRAALTSLDPADRTQADSAARRNIDFLIFDTLVATDGSGRIGPALSTSWRAAPGNQRWRFQLRQGVKFHDGTPLTAEIAAASLRAANPSWNVVADTDSVTIERDSPDPELPAELALAPNAIAKRSSEQRPSGTGPFHIVDWQPGKKLTLAAEEDYWGGRAFLDSIEIEMGRGFRDQLTALELGRADLVEVAPEQGHRVSLEGRRLASSEPMELLALVFAEDAKTPEEKALRDALAFCVDRGSMRNVLLQGAGQSTAGLLPNWLSGYAFVFSTDADLARARRERDQAGTIPAWTLGYDAADPLARLLAERIALNARDAGLSVQPTSATSTTLRLLRIPLASADPWITLAGLSAITGTPAVKNLGGSAEDLYTVEQSVLATRRIIPLFHLPLNFAASPALKDWRVRADGGWKLADAWLGSRQP